MEDELIHHLKNSLTEGMPNLEFQRTVDDSFSEIPVQRQEDCCFHLSCRKIWAQAAGAKLPPRFVFLVEGNGLEPPTSPQSVTSGRM